MATTEIMFPDQSDFEYDYETLRTTGVTLAVVLFVAGIFIALSKKIARCVKPSSKSNSNGTQIPKTEGTFFFQVKCLNLHPFCFFNFNFFLILFQFPLQLYENHNASLKEERCIRRVYTTNYAPAALWQFFHRLILVGRLDYLSPETFILS
uniref:FXYD domain-containing ion transport regulator n=1 Tax=Oryzias latipes TaxID=8090 RepID=A0A3B3IKG0_ORYLA